MFDHSRYPTVPVLVLNALDAHARHGHVPGHFVEAVLRNDLADAVCRADHDSLEALLWTVKYVLNELPAPCHDMAKPAEARGADQGSNVDRWRTTAAFKRWEHYPQRKPDDD